MTKRWAWGVLAGVISLACGGSSNSGLSGSGGGSSGGTAGSGGDGGATGGEAGTTSGGTAGSGGGGGETYPLDDVCELLAPAGCEMSKGCCESSGFGYAASGCEANAIADCEKNVAEVKAGTMTYDPSFIDACLPGFEKLLNQCVIGYGDLFASLDALVPCSKIWQGQRPVGSPCDRDAQCALSADPDVFSSCDDYKKICVQATRLSANGQCEASVTATSFCATGLYCDAAITPFPPYLGVCKPATPEGQGCNSIKAYDFECGAGFYCNKASAVCTKAKPGGTPCFDALECQSYQCNLGTCAPIPPVVTQKTCTG